MAATGGGGIAKTQFDTGPKDDLITVDVYEANADTATNNGGKTAGGSTPADGVVSSAGNSSSAATVDPATITNSAVSPESGGSIGPISEYAGANVKPNQLPETPAIEGETQSALERTLKSSLTKEIVSSKVKTELHDIKPSKVSSKKRLTGTGKQTAEALDKLDDKRVQSMLDKVDQDGTIKDVIVQVDDYNTIIGTADVGSVAGGVDLLRSLGNTEAISFLDQDAKLSALNEALDIAVEWNIPGIIDKLLESSNVDDKSFLLSVLPRAVRASNFSMVEDIIRHQSIAKCVAYMPTMLVDLFRYFSVSRRLEQYKWQEQLDRAIAIANSIDSNWMYTERNGEQVKDLNVFIRSSNTAKDLFDKREEWRAWSMISRNYFKTSKYFLMRQHYPKAPFTRF